MGVAIVGAGLAGLAAAVDLVDAGHDVEISKSRSLTEGKVSSWVDAEGNHIEMGLHVFFQTPIPNFFLVSRYTPQDYINSIEGATLSSRQTVKFLDGFLAELTSREPLTREGLLCQIG